MTREEAKEYIIKHCNLNWDTGTRWNNAMECAVKALEQPERKRGKWIEDDDGWEGVIWRCSECDALFTLVDGTPEENEYYFCPHCGADMGGEQDG